MKYISGADIVFVAAGLGGGTGTGSAPPYIASRAREAGGALAISVVTLPFSSEGAVRMNNAKWGGLTKLLSASDCVLVIPNDSLASVSPRH